MATSRPEPTFSPPPITLSTYVTPEAVVTGFALVTSFVSRSATKFSLRVLICSETTPNVRKPDDHIKPDKPPLPDAVGIGQSGTAMAS
eukprot:1178698-Prorocentrum_minimum.AAC.5